MPREINGIFYPMIKWSRTGTLMERILQVNDIQMNELLNAIMRRYHVLYPDWEVMFLSLPIDWHERVKAIENIIKLLKSIYKLPESD